MINAVAVPIVLAGALALLGYFALPGLIVKWALKRERKAGGLEKKRVRIGNHEIVYLEGGKGEPVLMLHGFAANKDAWVRFAKWIVSDHRVVALDLPGFGESSFQKDAAYGIENQATRIDRFTDALGLKKFHIVGNSMGGRIAARYAVMFPEKVLTLGLFDAAGLQSPVPSEMHERLSRGEPNPLVVGSVEEFDRLIRFVFSKPPEIPRFAKRVMAKEALRHRAANGKIFAQLLTENATLEPDLQKIKVRSLVLWGDRDRVLDVSGVQIMEKALPNCAVVIMKDCGHVPMMERPQETATHYQAFLRGA